MTLRLITFGSMQIERDQVPLGRTNCQRRRLALLTCLAVAGDRAATRDKLMSLLWPEH